MLTLSFVTGLALMLLAAYCFGAGGIVVWSAVCDRERIKPAAIQAVGYAFLSAVLLAAGWLLMIMPEGSPPHTSQAVKVSCLDPLAPELRGIMRRLPRVLPEAEEALGDLIHSGYIPRVDLGLPTRKGEHDKSGWPNVSRRGCVG